MGRQHDFDAFVVARTPALSRTAYLLTGDAHLAEDLMQTALFKAARALGSSGSRRRQRRPTYLPTPGCGPSGPTVAYAP